MLSVFYILLYFVCEWIFALTHTFILIDIYALMCVAVDPAEGEHGGGEPTVSGAEPEPAEGEPSLTGAEPGAP